MLTIQSCIPFFFICVVEAGLKICILGRGQIRADSISTAGSRNCTGFDKQLGFPYFLTLRGGIHLQCNTVCRSRQFLTITFILFIVDRCRGFIVDGCRKNTFIFRFVSQFFYLNFTEFKCERSQCAKLKIQIAFVSGGGDNTGNFIVSCRNSEFLKVSEFDKTSYVRIETISDSIIVAGKRWIIAFQFDVPGLSICFGCLDTVFPVDEFSGSFDSVPFKLDTEQ